jgi:hypothetical protein
LFALAPLGGCASDQINTAPTSLVGENIQVAVRRLGYPDQKRDVLGATLYIWRSDNVMAMPLANTTTTPRMVGVAPTMATYATTPEDCVLELGVDSNGTITTWRWSGEMIGCEAYVRELVR